MSTLGTMKSDIASDLERTLADDAMSGETWDDVIERHILDTIRMLKSRNWWFLQSPVSAALTSVTTADDSYVSDYSGLIQLDSLRITISGQLLEMFPITFVEMEERHDGSGTSGQPDEYTRFGGRVRLYPTPNDEYTLTWSGLFEEGTLAADGDSNDWCTHGSLVLKAQTKLKLYRDYIKDADGASAAQMELAEATMALDREHIRRMATNKIIARR